MYWIVNSRGPCGIIFGAKRRGWGKPLMPNRRQSSEGRFWRGQGACAWDRQEPSRRYGNPTKVSNKHPSHHPDIQLFQSSPTSRGTSTLSTYFHHSPISSSKHQSPSDLLLTIALPRISLQSAFSQPWTQTHQAQEVGGSHSASETRAR